MVLKIDGPLIIDSLDETPPPAAKRSEVRTKADFEEGGRRQLEA